MHRFFLLVLSLLFLSCASTNTTDESPKAVNHQPAPAPVRVDPFDEVRVVLGHACAPCHNPGGKMYAKLPFDQPDVIRANREGILRRLEAEDKKRVENWLLGQQKE